MENHEILRLIRNPELLDENSLPFLLDLIKEAPYFQTGWMLLVRNLKNIESPEFEDFLAKTALRVPDRKLLYQFLHPQPKANVPTGIIAHRENLLSSDRVNPIYDPEFESNDDNQVYRQSGIIERFLHKLPDLKISSRKKPTDEIDLSEKSSAEHDDFLTETLAEIYLKQNNIEKAIESFQKLSLKYPEKSIYFAARIEEIKEKLNH